MKSSKTLFECLLALSFFIFSFKSYAQWEPVKVSTGRLVYNRDVTTYGTKTAVYDSTLIVHGEQISRVSFAGKQVQKVVANISYDGGSNWKTLTIPKNDFIYFNFIRRNHTVGIGEKGIYLHLEDSIFFSNDRGSTWLRNKNLSTQYHDEGKFIFLDSIVLFLNQKYPSKILKSIAGQNSWETDDTFPNGITDVIATKDSVYCITNTDLYKSNFKRSVWTKHPLPVSRTWIYKAPGIAFDKGKLYYSTGSSNLYISKDGGKSWEMSNYIEGGSDVVVNGIIHRLNSQGIFVSSNDGKDWIKQDAGLKKGYGVAPISGNSELNLLFSPKDSMIYKNSRIFKKHYRDTIWQYCNNTDEVYDMPYDIRKYSDSVLVGISLRGSLFYSVDKGNKWNFFDRSYPVSHSKYLIVQKENIFIYNENTKTVLNTRDLGKTWNTLTTFPQFESHQVVNDTIFIVKPITDNNSNVIKRREIWYSLSPYTDWKYIADVSNASFFYKNGYILSRKESEFHLSKFNLATEMWGSLSQKIFYTEDFAVQGDNVFTIGSSDVSIYDNKLFMISDSGTISAKQEFFNVNIMKLGSIGKNTLFVSGYLENEKEWGGLLISRDNGKSWSQFTNGLKKGTDILALDVFNVNMIDDKIFLFERSTGLWIRDTSNLNATSLTGTVYWDKNCNGIQDGDDTVLQDICAYSNKSISITNENGFYNLLNEQSNHLDTVSISPPNRFATFTPPFYSFHKSDTAKNFLVKMPEFSDVSVILDAVTPPRPGFRNKLILTYTNNGSLPADGKISLTYDSKQLLTSAYPNSATHTNQTLTWQYSNLLPNKSEAISIIFKTDSTVLLSTRIANVAKNELKIGTDIEIKDNIDTLVQKVVGSYDPNDKQVTFTNSKTPPSVIDHSTELIYTIRFQNTGNYPADFVKIVDTLSDKLDFTTLRVISSSHKNTVSLKNKQVLTFDFNPIYLPDSISNEKDSHGFVKFAIKPKKTLTKDEAIKNTGYIYFDYNPAVITNTVETANQKINSLFTPSVLAGKLEISPNPTQQVIKIDIEDADFKQGTLSIYDLSGRLMFTKSISDKTGIVDVSHLSVGEYICMIKSLDNKVFVNKFVKVQ